MYVPGKMPTRNRNTRGRLPRLRNATHETQVSAHIRAAACVAGHSATARNREGSLGSG